MGAPLVVVDTLGTSEDVRDEFGESKACLDNLKLEFRQVLRDVVHGERLIFNGTVVGNTTQLVSLQGPDLGVQGHAEVGMSVVVDELLRVLSYYLPVGFRERLFKLINGSYQVQSGMILVQDTVPRGMKVTNREVVREVEQIPSLVSLREVLVNSCCTV